MPESSRFSEHRLHLLASAESTPTLHKFLYSRSEASWALGCSIRSLDYLVANKQLNFLRLGKKIMFSATELARFAKANHNHLTGSPEKAA